MLEFYSLPGWGTADPGRGSAVRRTSTPGRSFPLTVCARLRVYSAPQRCATSLRLLLRLCTGLGVIASAFVAVRLTHASLRTGQRKGPSAEPIGLAWRCS